MTHIKKLLWTDPQEPNNEICYDHVISTTPFGDITIDWKGWKDYPSYCIHMEFTQDGYVGSHDSLEAAMELAEEKWNDLINECIIINKGESDE